jgi:hypothetical protein
MINTRISQLPTNPNPVDPSADYVELSIPDISSPTGFTSVKEKLENIGSVSGVFKPGSSGNFSIRASNDSGIDATDDYSYAEGHDCQSTGMASHAEGTGSIASGHFSHAGGKSSQTDFLGEWCRSSSGNEAKYGIADLIVEIPNSLVPTSSELFIDGSERFVIPDNSAYRFEIKALAIETGTLLCKEWSGTGIIKRFGGNVSFVDSPTLGTSYEDAAMSGVLLTISADNTGKNLMLTATGKSGGLTSVRFYAKVEFIKVYV